MKLDDVRASLLTAGSLWPPPNLTAIPSEPVSILDPPYHDVLRMSRLAAWPEARARPDTSGYFAAPSVASVMR
jgi:hypothetical protein